MALLFMDGFDKYGGLNSSNASVVALIQQEWTSTLTGISIVAGLSSTGFALQGSGGNAGATKTLPGNYSRLIGGVRFSSSLGGVCAILFLDAATQQACIVINTTGTIAVRNGGTAGTILGTSTAAVAANSTHYLEWDITFSNTGSYQLWLDGVSILSGSGDTTASANNSASGVQLLTGVSAATTWDDLYIFDSTGTVNNAPLLTSPRIETTFPSSDNSVQFAVGAATLGNSVARAGAFGFATANGLYVRPYTPARNCTLNSISFLANATSGTLNFRPVVYADNAGSPTGGTLLSAGSTVTGMTSGSIVTMPLTTPQSLIAGTQYWLGWMQDIGATNGQAGADGLGQGRSATNVTFSAGAPGTCPTLSPGQTTVVVYGNITLASQVNYYEVASQPPQGLQSYLTDTTVADEDLYNFPALSQLPSTVHAVAVKANCSRSDTGARTVSMRMRSSGTDSGGSLTGQTPNASSSFGWLTSLFITDPNTGSAWLGTALNAAQSGFRIDT